jgi:hypothetical protein
MSSRAILFLAFLGTILVLSFINRVTHLSFCGVTYSIPEKCDANSKHQVKCESCEMSWSYVEGKTLNYAVTQAVKTFDRDKYQSKIDTITCYLAGKEISAIQVTSPRHGCYIVAHGIVNDHSVMVELLLHKKPFTNEHIPEAIHQILQLAE